MVVRPFTDLNLLSLFSGFRRHQYRLTPSPIVTMDIVAQRLHRRAQTGWGYISYCGRRPGTPFRAFARFEILKWAGAAYLIRAGHLQ